MQYAELTLSDGSKVKIWETGSATKKEDGSPEITHEVHLMVSLPDGFVARYEVRLNSKERPIDTQKLS